ncbi:MAG TPA: endopeptidase La [Bacteroidetes bacterium]|nr:endopeptidase La [Bacteroidota bacterium]
MRLDDSILGPIMESDVEFLPLISEEEEKEMNKQDIPDELSILPLKNTVLFPGVIIPITVGRDKSIKLIQDANDGSKLIGVVAQKVTSVEEPSKEDIFSIGTVAKIVKMLRMPDGNITVIIQGRRRFKIKEIISSDPYFKAKIESYVEKKVIISKGIKALVSAIKDNALQIIKLSPIIPTEASVAIENIDSPNFLINFISSNLKTGVKDKQEVLETDDFINKCELVLKHLNEELELLKLKKEIQGKVDTDISKQQRQFLLHQQLKTIQEELGSSDSADPEIIKLIKKSKDKKWPKKVKEVFDKDIKKLNRMNSAMPDYSVTLNYLEYLIDLPWEEYTKDEFDLRKSQKVLDDNHSGLEKVKKRILEHLAVLKLKGDMKSPILCLVGPPGVGKTSLGKSIANALGRQFVRMSLGGLHDESEIRGHRKTYIGAMPGRIVQSIKKASSANPVFILDEIDKVGNDFRGDPSSALLEVLDPEQNASFYDNYLELEYDLSKVMFIATANTIQSIQPALRDRMEIIEINGYTVEEKMEIAQKHLIPKTRKEHGLKSKDIKLTKKTLETIIESYTKESGVRGLYKKLANVMRNTAKHVATEEKYQSNIKATDLINILGAPIFEKDIYQDVKVPGVAIGLAWTSVGGDILFIEVGLSKGKGLLTQTGNLGDVMKESVTTALSFLKSNAEELDINPEIFNHWNIHLHVPEGAIPKDGPSAGVTMLSAIYSAITQRNVRPFLAMSGEITLRGKVLPVGGIKEKILAAKRAGIREVILCKNNKKDVDEIKPEHIEDLKFHYVTKMTDVLEIAVNKNKTKNPKDLESVLKKVNKDQKDQ